MPTKKKTAPKPNLINRLHGRLKTYMAARPHRSFRVSRWAKRLLGGKPLGAIWPLVLGSFAYIWHEKKIVGGLTLLYVVVTFLVVGGISQADFLELKDVSVQIFQGNLDSLGTAVELFTAAMSGILASPLEPLPQFLAFLLIFLFWLSLVWALRMRFANEQIKVRDALYASGGPIVPSLVVLAVIIVQLLPAAVGVLVLSQALIYGNLVGGIEIFVFSAGAALLCLLSLYWITASALALIIVTLPKVYPWLALSRASALVVGQRWKLMVRVLVLVGVVSLAWAVVLIPTLVLDGWLRFDWLPLIPVVAALMSGLTVTYSAVYIYRLYRSLL